MKRRKEEKKEKKIHSICFGKSLSFVHSAQTFDISTYVSDSLGHLAISHIIYKNIMFILKFDWKWNSMPLNNTNGWKKCCTRFECHIHYYSSVVKRLPILRSHVAILIKPHKIRITFDDYVNWSPKRCVFFFLLLHGMDVATHRITLPLTICQCFLSSWFKSITGEHVTVNVCFNN